MALENVGRKMSEIGDSVMNRIQINKRFEVYFYTIVILSALSKARAWKSTVLTLFFRFRLFNYNFKIFDALSHYIFRYLLSIWKTTADNG